MKETYKIEWQGIEIVITYDSEYFATADLGHIEVRASEPLPFTET